MVDFKKILKNANKNWKNAKKRVAESDPGFTEYPDGKYEAQLTSAKLGTSEGGRNQVAFGWKFVDGDYEGKVKTAYQGIDTEDNLYFLGRDLERLGYELPDDLTDLPDILKDLEKSKPVASINLKTKGDFQNVYIRKVYTESDEDDEDTDDDEEVTEEEIDEAEAAEEEEESEEEESEDDDAEESDDEEEEEGDEDSEEEEEEEEESDDDAEEEVDIEVGMRVQAETAKGREAGEIIEILEKEEKVRVKLDSGRTVKLGVDKIEIEAEDEEPEEKPSKTKKTAKPEPKKAPGKKSAPAPTKKKVASAPAKKTVAGKKKTGKR